MDWVVIAKAIGTGVLGAVMLGIAVVLMVKGVGRK